MSQKIPVEQTPFNIFIKPILENLLVPLFGYIATYVIYISVLAIFSGGDISLFNERASYVSTIISLLMLGITSVITVGRFLSDDVLIIYGKAMQEPKIILLKSENEKLKKQIQELKQHQNTQPIVKQSGEFANEELEIPTIVEEIVLDRDSQILFDNCMIFWTDAINGLNTTKAEMIGRGMAQRRWTAAYNLLCRAQIITKKRELLVFDRGTVVNILNQQLGDE